MEKDEVVPASERMLIVGKRMNLTTIMRMTNERTVMVRVENENRKIQILQKRVQKSLQICESMKKLSRKSSSLWRMRKR
jgi:hypothetical protein